jgi:hypothetical protein
MLCTDSKCYARAIQMKRVWCVLAMVTQEYFDCGSIITQVATY